MDALPLPAVRQLAVTEQRYGAIAITGLRQSAGVAAAAEHGNRPAHQVGSRATNAAITSARTSGAESLAP